MGDDEHREDAVGKAIDKSGAASSDGLAGLGEPWLTATLQALGEGVVLLDARGSILAVNETAADLLGGEGPTLAGRDFVDVVSGNWPRHLERRASLLALARGIRDRSVVRIEDGRFFNVQRAMFPVAFDLCPVGNGAHGEGFALAFRSRTEAFGLRTALSESEARFRAIFSAAGVAIARVWLDGEIAECNDGYAAMFGYARSELVGKPLRELLHLDDRESPAGGAEHRHVTRSGDILWCTTHRVVVRGEAGEPLFEIHLVEDSTQQKRLEAELRFSQKLESIGRLAAGVAHEINTPIQFVRDNLRFLQTSFRAVTTLDERKSALLREAGCTEASLEADRALDSEYLRDEIPRAVAQSLEGAAQVARIVQALKQFSHPETAAAKCAVDLNAAVESTLAVARSETKYVADVVFERGDVPSLTCYPGELNQVFLNLVVNAAHAIGDVVRGSDKRGRITVRTWTEGGQAVTSIADTGGGIPDRIHDKIFDPFFTTKEVGKGTGQGLAIARSVVETKHGGSITFEPCLGEGTTFFVRLPLRGMEGPPAARA